jgi:hypothetical protein
VADAHVHCAPEYLDFMAHATDPAERRRIFFLTGQPGIGKQWFFSILWYHAHALRWAGKSMGAYYFLFHLLASGQSVFFLPDTHNVYYFSEGGVEVARSDTHHLDDCSTIDAIRRSWIIIDVDYGDSRRWYPSRWVQRGACVVWTSPFLKDRMYRFTSKFGATRWFMKPWSLEEISALTCVFSVERCFFKFGNPW